MKLQCSFNGHELSVAGKKIDLLEVQYIEKVPLYGLYNKNFALEFVAQDGKTLYIPNVEEAFADSIVAQALEHGAQPKEHQLMFVPSEETMRKHYEGYCMVCDEGDMIAKKVYTRAGCSREVFKQEELKYVDEVRLRYCWVDTWWGKTVTFLTGWWGTFMSNVDLSLYNYHSVELTFAPDGKYSKGSVYVPYLSAKEASELVADIKSLSAVNLLQRELVLPMSEKSMYKLTKGYTVVMDEFDYVVKKVYGLGRCMTQRASLENISYVDEIRGNNFPGLSFGRMSTAGEASSFEIYGLDKKASQALTDLVVAKNAHLNMGQCLQYRSAFPLLNPARWFKKREVLCVTDHGIVHKQHSVVINGHAYQSRTSVLTYDKVKSYEDDGFIFRKISIYGDTNIETVESFGFWVKTAIWDQFRYMGIKNGLGTIFRASLRHRKDNFVVSVAEDNLIVRRGKSKDLLAYQNIYQCEFQKPEWYSLFGDLKIAGRVVDTRTGDCSDVQFTVTHMLCCKGRRARNLINRSRR